MPSQSTIKVNTISKVSGTTISNQESFLCEKNLTVTGTSTTIENLFSRSISDFGTSDATRIQLADSAITVNRNLKSEQTFRANGLMASSSGTVVNDGVTVVSGGATVTAGGATVTTGNLSAVNGTFATLTANVSNVTLGAASAPISATALNVNGRQLIATTGVLPYARCVIAFGRVKVTFFGSVQPTTTIQTVALHTNVNDFGCANYGCSVALETTNPGANGRFKIVTGAVGSDLTAIFTDDTYQDQNTLAYSSGSFLLMPKVASVSNGDVIVQCTNTTGNVGGNARYGFITFIVTGSSGAGP